MLCLELADDCLAHMSQRYMEPFLIFFLVPHIMGIYRTYSSSTVLNVNIHNQLTNLIN